MPGWKPGDQTRQPMMSRRNIRITLAFNGSAYCGWQIQKNQPTVQGLVSEAIARITGEQVNLTGSGRTDAGTHARGLAANFHTDSKIKPEKFVPALNSILPPDIRILSARQAALSFHARRDARSKIYRYQIYLGPILLPHLMGEFFHFPFPVDMAKIKRAAHQFQGEHDFASFAKSPAKPNTVRRIFRCDISDKGHRLLLTVEGNGFLHHMVRNMAGTLLEVGRGSITLAEFQELFNQRDRNLAGFTAPAHGLILLKVKY
jgi:tRNA pseudouridine38-40 synthase